MVYLTKVHVIYKKRDPDVRSPHSLFVGWRIGTQLAQSWLITLSIESIHTPMLWLQGPQAASDQRLVPHKAFPAIGEIFKKWLTVVD